MLAKLKPKEIKSPPPPTDEQQACIEAACEASSNLMIISYAGTGKTTSLEMIEKSIPEEDILYLAFNRDIVKEASERFRFTTKVQTLNSLGHGVWARAITNKVTLNKSKTSKLLREVTADLKLSQEDRNAVSASYWEIIRAVGLAKSLGYIPKPWTQHETLCSREAFLDSLDETPSDLVSSIVDLILSRSIHASYRGWIDFDDQIYMPGLFGGSFPRYSRILVDETQDLNPVNHAMLRTLCCGSWVGLVGDPFQSIYGFRGAITEGMSKLREAFACETKTISKSFRCPRAIVEAARWRVPGFQWVKEGGQVHSVSEIHPNEVEDGAAMICRNNAPLLKMAFHFLASGRSVNVAGSDIGPKITAIMSKLSSDHDIPRTAVIGLIEDWRDEKLAKAREVGTINDTADAMRVFAAYGDTLSAALTHITHLFAQRGTVTFSTGHKAKGQEWSTVYHLDPWLIGNSEQELNLRYVITTRSAETLIHVNSPRGSNGN